MVIAELIRELQKYPQDMRLVVTERDGDAGDVVMIRVVEIKLAKYVDEAHEFVPNQEQKNQLLSRYTNHDAKFEVALLLSDAINKNQDYFQEGYPPFQTKVD